LKCATFYFSANYPHAVHTLKAVVWLSLQLSKAATMTHSAVRVSPLQGEAEFFLVNCNFYIYTLPFKSLGSLRNDYFSKKSTVFSIKITLN